MTSATDVQAPAEQPAEPAASRDYEISESGAAEAFAATYGKDLKFEVASGSWYRWIWFEHRWRRDDLNDVKDLCRRFLMEFAVGKPALHRAATVSSVLSLAAAIVPIPVRAERFDKRPHLLGTPAGVVDLRTGELRAGGRDDLITKTTGIAPAEREAEPTRFLSFLEEALGGDRERIDFLHRAAGYALTGETREQSFLWLRGSGGTGTSTFVNSLLNVLGEYGAVLPADALAQSYGERHPVEWAATKGARLVATQELERGRRWAESRLKAFVGGDPITARYMRGDPFTFRPVGKLFVTSNGAPSFGAVDNGIRRRLLLVEFTVKPAAPDRLLADKLAKEASEILSWAISGAVAWYREGLSPPASVLTTSGEYLDAEDTLGSWLVDCCDVGVDEFDNASRLFGSWRRWCEQRNETAGSEKAFSHLLQQRGFERRRHLPGRHDERGYMGLSVRPEGDQ